MYNPNVPEPATHEPPEMSREEAEAADGMAAADALREPCPACNGFGTDDGEPCGSWARDFGADRPGPCAVCDGTGERESDGI